MSYCVAVRTCALALRVAALLPSPPVMIQKIVSRLNPCRACCSTPVLCRRVVLHRITALLCNIATQRSPLATIQTIVSRLTPWPGHPHALAHCSPLRAGRPCHSPAGSVMGLCRRVAGRDVAPCCTPQLPCVTIQSIVS